MKIYIVFDTRCCEIRAVYETKQEAEIHCAVLNEDRFNGYGTSYAYAKELDVGHIIDKTKYAELRELWEVEFRYHFGFMCDTLRGGVYLPKDYEKIDLSEPSGMVYVAKTFPINTSQTEVKEFMYEAFRKFKAERGGTL